MAEIHDLIRVHGADRARELVSPEKRRLIDLAVGLVEAEHPDALSYTHPGFALTCLPHKRLDPEQIWRREAANVTLTIEPTEVDGARHGVPYGSRARLILIYLQTEAVRNRARTVELGPSMHAWLRRMGIPRGGKSYRDVMEQARRIEGALLSFTWRDATNRLSWRDTIIRGRFRPIDDTEYRQARLFVDTVELSETFFEALMRHPAPISEAALRLIANKSMVIDIYLWLSYRLHALEKSVPIHYHALQKQFGFGYARHRAFVENFILTLKEALAVYPEARVGIVDTGVILHPSPPPGRMHLISGR